MRNATVCRSFPHKHVSILQASYRTISLRSRKWKGSLATTQRRSPDVRLHPPPMPCECLPADPLLAVYSPCTFPTRMTAQFAVDLPCRPHLQVQHQPGQSHRCQPPSGSLPGPPGDWKWTGRHRTKPQLSSGLFHSRVIIRCKALPLLNWSSAEKQSAKTQLARENHFSVFIGAQRNREAAACDAPEPDVNRNFIQTSGVALPKQNGLS